MTANCQRQWRDVTNAKSETKAIQILAEVLADKQGKSFVLNLEPKDAELCIEILDRGIKRNGLNPSQKQDFFSALRRLAASRGHLPESMVMSEEIKVEEEILASGGFSDVRRGIYEGHRVAVRALRVTLKDDISKIRKQFCKEVILWSTLSHPNVLQFAGVYGDLGKRQFVTVSEWMVHGNIMEYIKLNHVNRLELLHGAAQGLEYLHGANLVHGDLKGANILMSNDVPPRACLADFGFMTMVLDPDHPMTCSTQLEGGTTMFMPPELLAPQKFCVKNPTPTSRSDVYAFALVIFQVLTGENPFRGFGPMGHIFSIVEGLRPTKPNNALAIGFSDQLWAFVQRCWNADRYSRPDVAATVAHLSQASSDWNGLMPPHIKAEYVSNDSQVSISESMRHCPIFQESPNTDREDTENSPTASAVFSNLGPPSTQFTDPPVVAVSVHKPWMPRGPDEEPRYPHLNQNYGSPPSLLPTRKWTSFRYLKCKFRKIFGLCM